MRSYTRPQFVFLFVIFLLITFLIVVMGIPVPLQAPNHALPKYLTLEQDGVRYIVDSSHTRSPVIAMYTRNPPSDVVVRSGSISLRELYGIRDEQINIAVTSLEKYSDNELLVGLTLSSNTAESSWVAGINIQHPSHPVRSGAAAVAEKIISISSHELGESRLLFATLESGSVSVIEASEERGYSLLYEFDHRSRHSTYRILPYPDLSAETSGQHLLVMQVDERCFLYRLSKTNVPSFIEQGQLYQSHCDTPPTVERS